MFAALLISGHRRRRGAGRRHDRDPDPLPARPPRAHPRPAPDGRARRRVRRRRAAADPLPLRRSASWPSRCRRRSCSCSASCSPTRPARAERQADLPADAGVVSGAAALGDGDRRAVRDDARRRAHVHGQRRARRRAVGDRRGASCSPRSTSAPPRPASSGASPPTGPAERVASRTLSALGLLGAATVIPFPFALRAGPRAGRDRGRAAGVRHARLQRHRVRDRGRGGRPVGGRRGRRRVDGRVPDRIDHAARRSASIAEKSGFAVMFASLAVFCVAGALTARRIAHRAYTPA